MSPTSPDSSAPARPKKSLNPRRYVEISRLISLPNYRHVRVTIGDAAENGETIKELRARVSEEVSEAVEAEAVLTALRGEGTGYTQRRFGVDSPA